MSDAGGQIQHVALARLVDVAIEWADEREIVARIRVFGDVVFGHVPDARTDTLAQEYVVVVAVRADPATVGGVADHHVVQPPVRNEAESFEQIGEFGDVPVRLLHEHGPTVVWQAVELPYVRGELAMVVLVPDAGRFAEVEADLAGNQLIRQAAGVWTGVAIVLYGVFIVYGLLRGDSRSWRTRYVNSYPSSVV